MIERLKTNTRDLHEEVEKENLASQIIDHSIQPATYRKLLIQNYLAYKSTEDALTAFFPDLPLDKHLRLEKDLEELDVDVKNLPLPENLNYSNYAEACGAAYVVEGSALGGMLISRHLEACAGLGQNVNSHFFNAAKTSLDSWKAFRKQLEETHFTEAQEQAAIEQARNTFKFFRRTFRRNHF